MRVELIRAIAALQRIARQRAGFEHRKAKVTFPDGEEYDPCPCPRCTARDALADIVEMRKERRR